MGLSRAWVVRRVVIDLGKCEVWSDGEPEEDWSEETWLRGPGSGE